MRIRKLALKELKVATGERVNIIERPLQKLCLLELYAEEEEALKKTLSGQDRDIRRST